MTSQLRRAAVSVVTNIVEGASRQHKNDYLNFLYISRGSLAETEYLLGLSYQLEYLNKVKFIDLEESKNNTAKMLFGLIEAVSSEIPSKRP